MLGYVRNIIPHSAVDGPGNRFVIFFQGCNFNCRYCHNPETIPLLWDNEKYEMSVDTLEELVLKHSDYLSGVTFTGGECSLQLSFLQACCQRLKKHRIHILIDTNGSFLWDQIQKILPFVDGFMVDLKAKDEHRHMALTDASNRNVLENILKLKEVDLLFEVRLVIVQGMTDERECLDWLKDNGLCEVPLKLIKYRAHGVSKRAEDLITPTDEDMISLRTLAHEMGFQKVTLI